MTGRPREFDRGEVLEDPAGVLGHVLKHLIGDLVSATGLASARLYAACSSKEALMFGKAIERYGQQGGFADRALAEEPTARRAIERILREQSAILHATRCPQLHGGQLRRNCSPANDAVRQWLAEHRRKRTDSLVERLRIAMRAGKRLREDRLTQALGDTYAVMLRHIGSGARRCSP